MIMLKLFPLKVFMSILVSYISQLISSRFAQTSTVYCCLTPGQQLISVLALCNYDHLLYLGVPQNYIIV